MLIPASVPPPPTIPLTDAARAAYQSLYDKLQAEIESTNDAIALDTLNDARDNINDILTKDAMYRLHANTALFAALLAQIEDTNDDLDQLKAKVDAVAAHIGNAADIIAAIDKVLTLFPAL